MSRLIPLSYLKYVASKLSKDWETLSLALSKGKNVQLKGPLMVTDTCSVTSLRKKVLFHLNTLYLIITIMLLGN